MLFVAKYKTTAQDSTAMDTPSSSTKIIQYNIQHFVNAYTFGDLNLGLINTFDIKKFGNVSEYIRDIWKSLQE